MEPNDDPSSVARALFKRFLADRWFGGPDFESWVHQHRDLELELHRLRDEWLAELEDPDSPGLLPATERGARRAASFCADEVIGGFRLKKRLGSGASGEVWEAEELALGNRRVALKLLRPDLVPDPRALERFRREALAGSRINHPGVIAVYSVGRPRGQPLIAQELVEGGATLAALIASQNERGGPDAAYFRRVAELVAQTAEALAAAHALGILHRDIKPQNLLVAAGERVKVADFGLAHLAGENVLSHTGDVMGTLCYMSPAQVRGQVKQLDQRTDVFSLGATLYELLTLTRAFQGSSLHEVAQKILFEDPPAARMVQPRVPPHLELICSKALEKRLADRLPNMHEFAAELRRFLAGEPSLLKHTTAFGRALKWTRRHPTTSVSLGLVVVASVGIAWTQRVEAERREKREAETQAAHEHVERERLAAQREALFAKAQVAIEMGDIDEAVTLAKEANALDESDPTGHLFLAAGYARFERISDVNAELALARAKGFSESPANLSSALEHAAHALYLHSQREFGLYPEAERYIARALELDPKLYALELTRFQMRVALEDRLGALRALVEFQSHIPQREPQFPLLEAIRQELSGDPEAALATLDALAGRPEMTGQRLSKLHWHRNAGRLCVALGEFERAEQLLRQAVVDLPTDCWSWDNLGVLFFKRFQTGEQGEVVRSNALEFAERASACSASLFNPHLIRGGLAEWQLKRLPPGADPTASPFWRVAHEAVESLRALPAAAVVEEERLKLESVLFYLEATEPYRRGDYAAAGTLFERALELWADDLRSAALLGQCHWHLARPAEGLERLERALARWDDPGFGGKREAQYLGAILAWSIGNAARLPDAAAFTRAAERFLLELERGAVFQKEELLTAAEFLGTAPEELRACDLAWKLIDEHDLGHVFEGTPAETEASRVLEQIAAACP